MKKIIVFFLWGLSFHFLHSQSTWEYNWKKEGKREIMIHSIEFERGKLISISVESDLNKTDTNSLAKSIIRFHDIDSGKIEKEVTYKIDTLSTTLSWVFYNENDKRFIIVGEAHTTELPLRRGYFFSTTWDKNLNFISDTIVKLEPLNEGNVLWYIMGYKKSENELIVFGTYNNYLEQLGKNRKQLLINIDSNGNIKINNWFKRNSGPIASIFYDSELNKFVLISSMTYYLDYDFKIIDSLPSFDIGHYYSGFGGRHSNFDENKYLITVRFDDAGYARGLAFFDRNLNFLKGIKIETLESDWDFPFARQNLDYIDTSEIYFGVQNSNLTYYSVGKVNSNLDPYWIKYFSLSDPDRHYVWSITATLDGGCIIVGAKGQDFENEIPNDLSAWAIKLDADGNTVSTKDPGSDAWEITVFPNPSSGDFKIDISGQSSDAKLLLFDIQGREVKRYTDLHTGTNTFIFDNLPQGTYIWKLLNKEKEIGNGKWVKLGK